MKIHSGRVSLNRGYSLELGENISGGLKRRRNFLLLLIEVPRILSSLRVFTVTSRHCTHLAPIATTGFRITGRPGGSEKGEKVLFGLTTFQAKISVNIRRGAVIFTTHLWETFRTRLHSLRTPSDDLDSLKTRKYADCLCFDGVQTENDDLAVCWNLGTSDEILRERIHFRLYIQ